MNRNRLTRPPFALALAAAAAVGCTDRSDVTAPAPLFAELTAVLVVWPDVAELTPGDQQTFTAYLCPLDASGNWDPGPDGVPGTTDDSCFPVTVAWSVLGDIGGIGPTTGSSTTLTASLPEGSTLEMGTVRATLTDQSADADVLVVDEGEPIGDKGKAKVPCVQFTSQGTDVGKPSCRANVASLTFTFDADKGLAATFNKQVIAAPKGQDGLKLEIEGEKVVRATWLNRAVPTPFDIPRSKTVDLMFPAGSDGKITAAAWDGTVPITIPTPDAGKNIDDAHVRFVKVKENKPR